MVLNSNCDKVGGCGKLSAQGRWLRADLANHPASCTVASFHHPFYGIREFIAGTGRQSPDSPMRQPPAINSEVRSEKSPGVTAYGVLKLDLYAGSYAWEFRPIEGETFTDSGTDLPVQGLQPHCLTLMR